MPSSTSPCRPQQSHSATPRIATRWKVLAAGTLANTAFSVVINGLPLTAILMRTSYSLDNASLALALGLMGLGIALSELPWGMLTDAWGDRPVLLTGLFSTVGVLAVMAFEVVPHDGVTPSFAVLCGAMLIVGLMGGSVNGSSGRAIMSWFAANERGLAMSIRQTAIPLGGALAALSMPWLAATYGFGTLFGTLAAFNALAAILVWAWVRQPDVAATAHQREARADQSMPPSALRSPTVWRISMGIGLLCAPQFAILIFGTVFLHDAAHVSMTGIAIAMATLQIGAMVMRVWSGRWTDQRGNRIEYLRACAGLSAALFAVLAMAVTLGLSGTSLAVWMAVAGICVSAWHGVAYAELATRAGAPRAGTALGLCNTLVFLANFATPQAVAQWLPEPGWSAVWWMCAATALIALPLIAAKK
ncbi:MFS transporter [Diaphorobacter sp. HDW4A]|uniref:MFS transporter n=1 Tax=Diaphorobacter sp. HDW4A TaxID=2714924 RepID=UPI00140B1468|nr:MFS transporter [Diaphorobacter sp. HDW4A]QIL81075.1 MFS transporter [Diaphorobacter sp. HDW4A]